MIDITSFLLKHLYELMADNYNAANQQQQQQHLDQSCLVRHSATLQDQQEADDLEAAPTSEAEPTTGQGARLSEPKQTDLKRALSNQNSHTQSDTTPATNSSSSISVAAAAEAPPASSTGRFLATIQRHFNYCRLYQQQRRRSQQQQQSQTSASTLVTRNLLAREQETNQQIVSFLINNQLPDLACETLVELIFICVFLAVSWIFVMIIQLHCHQATTLAAAAATVSTTATATTTAAASTSSQNINLTPASFQTHLALGNEGLVDADASSYDYARDFYCNTKFLNSLMYCNNRDSRAYSA